MVKVNRVGMLIFRCFLLLCFSFFMSVQASAVTENKKIERIIVLAPHSVEMLFRLDAGDMIVGTTEYSDYPEAANAIPRIGAHTGINMEKVLALEPDLIIAWESGNPKKDLEQMDKLGLNVYRSKTDSISDIPKEFIYLGKLIGKEAKAKEVVEDFNARLEQIRQANAHKSKVPFFYQLWLEPLRTLTEGSWINPILSYCGGVNIFPAKGDMHYPQVSMENVLLNMPEAIIIPSHHGAANVSADHWSNWPEIPAVKNENIYFINGDILHRYTYRILEGMEAVCAAFDEVRNKSISNHSNKNHTNSEAL